MGLLAAMVALPSLAGCCFPAAGGNAPVPVPTPSPTPAQPTSAPVPAAAPPAASAIRVASVVFARALDQQWQPIGEPVTAFRADEHTVWARVTIDGRPRAGTVTMRWMWRDLKIGEAVVDLANVNGGVLVSFGENTIVRGNLNTPQLYIGAGHRLVLLAGSTELGSYPFTVVAPAGARPSRFVSAGLYAANPGQRDPGPPVTTFHPNDTVFVAGRVALGQSSWLDALFTVNGQPSPALTQETIGPPGGGDELPFLMQARPPAGGWPPGQHRVTIVLNDQDVGRYDFTVGAAP